MSKLPSPLTLACFGKLPARGDFVRSAGQVQLTQTLDRWLTQGMDLLSEDARWKLLYDAMAPAHFAFLGTHSPIALAGHLMASKDASGRRFPFVVAGMFDVPQMSQGLLACTTAALSPAWARLEALSRRAGDQAADIEPLLSELAQTRVHVDLQPEAYASDFSKFLGLHSVGSLEVQLRQSGHDVSLRLMLLAIGLLMQPVVAHGTARLERGLALPLPQDPLCRPLVGSLWLAMVTPFICRHDLEMAVFMRNAPSPQLVVGFRGASARTFRGLVQLRAGQTDLIDVGRAEWVEDQAGQSYGVRRLSSYLAQPDLPLQAAFDGFIDTFLGNSR